MTGSQRSWTTVYETPAQRRRRERLEEIIAKLKAAIEEEKAGAS